VGKANNETGGMPIETAGYRAKMHDLGGYTVSYESHLQDADPAPLYKGLPDDRCQCPHWGIVVKGKVIARYADGTQDEINEGESYYMRPGHLPIVFAGTELIEFSPTPELSKTIEAVLRNMQASSG